MNGRMLRVIRHVRRGKSAKSSLKRAAKSASTPPTALLSHRVYLSGETVALEEEEEVEEDSAENGNDDENSADADPVSLGSMITCRGFSLGTGRISSDGMIYFQKAALSSQRGFTEEDNAAEKISISGKLSPVEEESFAFERHRSYFMRIADLALDCNAVKKLGTGTKRISHYHYPSHEPPPLDADNLSGESWVALDNGINGQPSPLAPVAVDALARTGLDAALGCGSCRNLWAPQKSTEKFLTRSSVQAFANLVRPLERRDGVAADSANGVFRPLVLPSLASAEAQEVCLWTGSFSHGCHGSDLPSVRSVGIVDMSPKALALLLWDSQRVKEYNTMSLGRTDELHLPDGPKGSQTKVVRSLSKPPLLRKNVQLVTLMHCRPLYAEDDDKGENPSYLIVSRAVANAEMDVGSTGADVIRSEILLGVNLLCSVRGDPNRCLMMNVNHIRSPTSAPQWMLRKVGLSAAVNFIHDMQNLSKKRKSSS